MTGTREACRPPHVDLPNTPYFVSTRTHQSRRTFVGPTAKLAHTEPLDVRNDLRLLLLAFVFMPDHAHLVLVPPPEATLSRAMQLIKGRIARRINEERGTQRTFWQQGFYDKIVRTREQPNAFIEYTQRNPVEAGLVERDATVAASAAVFGRNALMMEPARTEVHATVAASAAVFGRNALMMEPARTEVHATVAASAAVFGRDAGIREPARHEVNATVAASAAVFGRHALVMEPARTEVHTTVPCGSALALGAAEPPI